MMAENVFQFDQYTVRPVGEKDRAYIDKLTDADPYHRGIMDADWFLNIAPGEGAWAIEDEKGDVVLYFKTQTAVRLSLQFAEQKPSVNRDALVKGMAWLEGMLFQNQFREIIFDTHSPLLKATAQRRLGFVEEPGYIMTHTVTGERVTGHWHHQPTAFEEAG
jgi:hypothetical protein